MQFHKTLLPLPGFDDKRTPISLCDSERDSTLIQCPCGSNFLHHEHIEVFNREHEDSDTGIHVVLDDQYAFQDIAMEANPSDRRSGILIGCWCEECGRYPLLAFYQHKGNTFIEWTGREWKHDPKPGWKKV